MCSKTHHLTLLNLNHIKDKAKGGFYMNNHFNEEDYKSSSAFKEITDFREVIDVIPKESKTKKYQKTKGKALSIFMASILSVSSFALGGAYVNHKVDSKLAQLESQISSTASVTNSAVVQQTATTVKSSSSELSVVDIANIAGSSVVEIRTESVSTNRYLGQYVTEGAGSGVIISSDGYIVTNNHVISGANKITVTLKNNETYTATLIGSDSQTDLAVLHIEAAGLTAATYGNSDSLQVGELAVAIGNPLGQLGGTVTDGIISALDREITLDGKQMNLLQTSTAINPGNSGGGLFNGQGELVGIVVAKSSGSDIEGIGFAIPVNDVKSVVDSLMNDGYVKNRPALGVSILDATSAETAYQYGLSQRGLYVAALTEGGNAKAAGVQVGDYIIGIANTQITSTADISSVLQNYSVGDTVEMTLSRSGKMVTVHLKLSELKP